MAIEGKTVLRRLLTIVCVLWLAACAAPEQKPVLHQPVEPTGQQGAGKTVALLGATGMVGGFVLQEALAQGYSLRVLARTPQKLDALKNKVVIVKGDARDKAAIRTLLTGSDIVISALGPVKADGSAADGISTAASGHVVQVMNELNIGPYIVVSGAAVRMPGDQRNLKGWLIETLARIAYGSVVRDKQSEYDVLAGSTINWTLVRCPVIDPQPYRGDAIATLDTPHSFNVRAGELARFMIEQIDSPAFSRRGPFLGSD